MDSTINVGIGRIGLLAKHNNQFKNLFNLRLFVDVPEYQTSGLLT